MYFLPILEHTGNYLRVRGEYIIYSCFAMSTTELPPRARRIHPVETVGLNNVGTTSACAENTLNELGLL